MPFRAGWMEEYALLWIRDKACKVLLDIVNSRRKEIAELEEKGTPLWPLYSQETREKVLKKVYNYGPTIMELDPDELTDAILDSLKGSGIELKREWAKSNLLAFREELAAIL